MITIPAHRMAEAASALGGLARDNSPKPILSTVRLSAKSGKASLMATNLEAFASITLDGTEIESECECCIPANKLFSFHGNYPKDALRITVNDNACTLSVSSAKLKLQTMDAKEYPVMLMPEKLIGKAVDGLLPAACRVAFALKRESAEHRYALQGPALISEADSLYLAASDGRVLAIQKVGSTSEAFGSAAFVPIAFSLLRNLDGEVEVFLSDNAVGFRDHSRSFCCRRIEGRYPNVFQVQLGCVDATAHSVRESLSRELRSASMATNINSQACDVAIKPGQIELSSKSEIGVANATLPTDSNGTCELSLDAKIFLDAVNSFPAGAAIEIKAGVSDVGQALRLTSEEHGYYSHIQGFGK